MSYGSNPASVTTPQTIAPQTTAPQTPYAAPTAAPVSMATPTAPNVYQQSANAYTTALQGPNIAQFQNPFMQQVINRTMGDIQTAQQQGMNQIGANATQARAFGGSRHGIAEAQANQDYMKQLADTSANLNMQGFNTALGAAQAQQNTLGSLAQQGFNMGNTIAANQSAAGTTQQNLLQGLIDAAKKQYGGFTGAPANALGITSGALGSANMGQQTQTSTKTPGLFDYLTAATSIFG